MKLIKSLALCCSWLSASVLAQALPPMWQGTTYDTSIPSFEQVLGYAPGERISNHSQMLRYFQALEKAAPGRIKVFEYAQSWEGRSLIYAAIGREQAITTLDQFATSMQLLASPERQQRDDKQRLLANLPASTWLAYGVHGNEISSTDAAMFTAYHLLAAKDDALVNTVLDNSIVFIDPLQNPDGRERFTSRYYASVGLEHSADRYSAEHNEPWPSGRTNHYLFDMNRDWLAITQPESKGRIAALNHFKPLVVIDLHEMGGDESYYFAPAAEPFNPHMTATQIANMNQIGRNHSRHFDQYGFDYFTREIFDAFYPGYGDSWPTFYGASASTYEVGSARGEIFRRKNGELYTYRDSVQRHVVASLSTVEATATMRSKLLRDFADYQTDSIALGKKSKQRVYLLPNTRDRAGNHRLATLMAEHGVVVHQATDNFSACGVKYPAGAYFIDTAQPRGRFVTTTFTAQVNMDDGFIKEQERRRARYLSDEIYDVTAWSLPKMFNLDVASCDDKPSVQARQVSATDPLEGKFASSTDDVAYIVPWGDMSAVRFLTAALRAGLVIKSADKAFTLDGGKRYPAGSLVIERGKNSQSLSATLTELAAQSGALIDNVSSSWVVDGPSFGSNGMAQLVTPNIAIAWDEPTYSSSTGNTRFVIERQMGYPVTAIRSDDLMRADLSRYQVLILPNGYYAGVLGTAGADKLKSWVEQGGVLVTFSGGTRYIADAQNGLLDVKREFAIKDEAEQSADDGSMVKGSTITTKQQLLTEVDKNQRSPDHVAGVLANIDVDQEHWLTAGVNPTVVGVVAGSEIYTPIKLNSGMNLAWFSQADTLLASGYLWQQNREQLAFKPYLMQQPVGKGMVIAFTQEPTFRAYLDGLNVMVANALFRAPAQTAALH